MLIGKGSDIIRQNTPIAVLPKQDIQSSLKSVYCVCYLVFVNDTESPQKTSIKELPSSDWPGASLWATFLTHNWDRRAQTSVGSSTLGSGPGLYKKASWVSHWEQPSKCGLRSRLGLPQWGTKTLEQTKLLPATSVFIHVFIPAIKLLPVFW